MQYSWHPEPYAAGNEGTTARRRISNFFPRHFTLRPAAIPFHPLSTRPFHGLRPLSYVPRHDERRRRRSRAGHDACPDRKKKHTAGSKMVANGGGADSPEFDCPPPPHIPPLNSYQNYRVNWRAWECILSEGKPYDRDSRDWYSVGRTSSLHYVTFNDNVIL